MSNVVSSLESPVMASQQAVTLLSRATQKVAQRINSQKTVDNRTELREAFDAFVGQTFFSQLLSSMRQTVGTPAYFHGGRAEEVFQSQLDHTLAERIAETSAEQFTEPMFELFTLRRS